MHTTADSLSPTMCGSSKDMFSTDQSDFSTKNFENNESSMAVLPWMDCAQSKLGYSSQVIRKPMNNCYCLPDPPHPMSLDVGRVSR